MKLPTRGLFTLVLAWLSAMTMAAPYLAIHVETGPDTPPESRFVSHDGSVPADSHSYALTECVEQGELCGSGYRVSCCPGSRCSPQSGRELGKCISDKEDGFMAPLQAMKKPKAQCQKENEYCLNEGQHVNCCEGLRCDYPRSDFCVPKNGPLPDDTRLSVVSSKTSGFQTYLAGRNNIKTFAGNARPQHGAPHVDDDHGHSGATAFNGHVPTRFQSKDPDVIVQCSSEGGICTTETFHIFCCDGFHCSGKTEGTCLRDQETSTRSSQAQAHISAGDIPGTRKKEDCKGLTCLGEPYEDCCEGFHCSAWNGGTCVPDQGISAVSAWLQKVSFFMTKPFDSSTDGGEHYHWKNVQPGHHLQCADLGVDCDTSSDCCEGLRCSSHESGVCVADGRHGLNMLMRGRECQPRGAACYKMPDYDYDFCCAGFTCSADSDGQCVPKEDYEATDGNEATGQGIAHALSLLGRVQQRFYDLWHEMTCPNVFRSDTTLEGPLDIRCQPWEGKICYDGLPCCENMELTCNIPEGQEYGRCVRMGPGLDSTTSYTATSRHECLYPGEDTCTRDEDCCENLWCDVHDGGPGECEPIPIAASTSSNRKGIESPSFWSTRHDCGKLDAPCTKDEDCCKNFWCDPGFFDRCSPAELLSLKQKENCVPENKECHTSHGGSDCCSDLECLSYNGISGICIPKVSFAGPSDKDTMRPDAQSGCQGLDQPCDPERHPCCDGLGCSNWQGGKCERRNQ